MISFLLSIAAVLVHVNKDGVDFKLETENDVVDYSKSVLLTATMTAPSSQKVEMPDLRQRARGFISAEDYEEEPIVENGKTIRVVNWKLQPAPGSAEYKIAPFSVCSSVAGPVYFKPPELPHEHDGDYEYVPKKALPPFGWKLVGWVSVFLAAFASLLLGLWKLVKFIASKIKEHRMSPIERARLELERLLQKDLPSLGKFKDFYVELTLVVRRYVQRKYGVRAPNMTTEEFLRETKIPNSESLEKFLQSADMVKFAGISATREMADTAVGATKDYIETDNARVEETK
jgi:hypothetical protein